MVMVIFTYKSLYHRNPNDWVEYQCIRSVKDVQDFHPSNCFVFLQLSQMKHMLNVDVP